jgi:hypothetical protein
MDTQLIHWLGFTADGGTLVNTSASIELWNLRRARRDLAAIGLDLDAPPIPDAAFAPPMPRRVEEVNLGGVEAPRR